MAWKAVITDWDLDAPSVTTGYYDDANPANTPTVSVILYSHTFSRADFGSPAELRAAVITVGQQKRTAYQRVQAIQAAGAIAIP